MNPKDRLYMKNLATTGRPVLRKSDNMAGVIKKVYGHGVYEVLWANDVSSFIDIQNFILV